MSTIYLDASAVAASDALERLAHLVDAGHELVLVTSKDHDREPRVFTARIQALPDEPQPGSWFVTADPATCSDRQAALRTVLIGPRAATRRPTRCDSTARDLRDAVLEILTADAMR